MRLVVWGVAILGALFPPIYASHNGMPPWHVQPVLEKIIGAGLFRDLFYVTIIVALIALSNIIYNVLAVDGYMHIWTKGILLLAFLFFLFVVITGVGEFSSLAAPFDAKVPVPRSELETDFDVLKYTLVFGAVTEMVLAFRDL